MVDNNLIIAYKINCMFWVICRLKICVCTLFFGWKTQKMADFCGFLYKIIKKTAKSPALLVDKLLYVSGASILIILVLYYKQKSPCWGFLFIWCICRTVVRLCVPTFGRMPGCWPRRCWYCRLGVCSIREVRHQLLAVFCHRVCVCSRICIAFHSRYNGLENLCSCDTSWFYMSKI